MGEHAASHRRWHLGPYALEDFLGRGGTGNVWSARDRRSGERVAVKILRPDRPGGSHRSTLRTEAAALRLLDHPGIPRLRDVGRTPHSRSRGPGGGWRAGSSYLVTDLVVGESVLTGLARWPFPVLRRVLLQTLSALAHAHARGVLHRDIKPGNLLVGQECVVLVDFGLASLGWPTVGPCDHDGMLLGSASYMAPEQVRGATAEFGPWTDLYALGCTAWRLVTGQPVFSGTLPQVLACHLGGHLPDFAPRMPVPGGLEPWLRRTMALDPADRFESAPAAAEALRALGTPAPSTARTGDAAGGSPNVHGRGEGVGHERARRALQRGLAEVVATGRRGAMVLRGSGLDGPSSLAKWLCERAGEAGLAGYAVGRHGDPEGPRDGLGPMICHLIGSCSQWAPDVRVRAGLRSRMLGVPLDGPRLAALFGRSRLGPEGPTASFAPEERIAEAAEVVRAEAGHRPIVLWLDNAQRAPECLALALRLLEDDAPEVPVLVLVSVDDADPGSDVRALESLRSLQARSTVCRLRTHGPAPARKRCPAPL